MTAWLAEHDAAGVGALQQRVHGADEMPVRGDVDRDHGVVGHHILDGDWRVADLGDFTGELAARESVHGEFYILAFRNAADIGLGDAGVDLHFGEVVGDDEQSGGVEAGRHGLAEEGDAPGAERGAARRGGVDGMCLGIPAKILSVEGDSAVVEVGGVRREISLMLVDGASAGEWVIVHAGFAIEKLSEEEAGRTLALFREIVDTDAYRNS